MPSRSEWYQILDVELAQVFEAADGIAYAAGAQMRRAQVDPFVCKLTAGLQQGHEIPGEGLFAASGPGAHDELGRDVESADLHVAGCIGVGKHVLQHGRIRIKSGGNAGAVILFALFLGVYILFKGFGS